MEQYISKSAVVAEIERLKAFYDRFDDNIQSVAKYNVLVDILSLLNTFEVKEVDLEKEMNDYFVSMEVQENENIFESTFRLIAKYYFNLGLKAQVNKIYFCKERRERELKELIEQLKK